MSIQLLEQRLTQKLQERTQQQGLKITLPEPHRLLRRLKEIEHTFDQQDYDIPNEDKILKAIEKLEIQGTATLSKREWKYIAWGLCRDFPHRPKKLIFLEKGFEALDFLRTVRKDLIPSLYTPLLFSYFALGKKELNQNSNNWLILRDILFNGLADLYVKYKRPKDWMLILSDYNELLQTQPTKRLSIEFINSTDDQKISTLLNSLRIPTHSWFWDRLMEDAIKAIHSLSDIEFKEKINRLLSLAETNPIYSVKILANTLDRYANSQYRDQIHERLKQMALTQWGSPQYESSVGWSNVQEDTKKMVIQWFVQADLEAFFKLFSDNADERRFVFWMKYLKIITASKLFFSKSSYNSNQAQQRRFLEKNKGRYSHLSGTSSDAFMLRIGNIFIIEFSGKGNACYVYKTEPDGIQSHNTEIFCLKNKQSIGFYGAWSHIPYNSWEDDNFSPKLKVLGIFPDNERYISQVSFLSNNQSFMKTCSRCGKRLDANYFYLNSNEKDGLTKWCKKCIDIV